MRIATLIATVVLGAGVVSAQSLGDVARQERMRRAGLEKHSPVLTNEDLSHAQILPAKAQETAASEAQLAPPRAEAPAQEVKRALLPVGQGTRWEAPEISLGEYARKVRAERARREVGTNPEGVAQSKALPPPAAAGLDSGVPAWTAAEQPSFSLGEYARAQRALRRKDAPIQYTLEAKVAPAAAVPAPKPALIARQPRKSFKAQPAAAPSSGAIMVKSGDSLWKLSRAHLGEGRLWTAIWTANPQVHNPNLIHPGQSLSRPTELQLAAARRALSTGRMELAKLAPAPRRASRSARLRPAGAPAGKRGPAGPVAVMVDGQRVSHSESYIPVAKRLPAANRSVASVLPGPGGLR